MNRECNHFDAYLAGDLPTDRMLSFDRHASVCGPCREAIDQQRWIDNLLQLPTRFQLEPIPVELPELVRNSASKRRRSVQLAAYGLAVAATILLAAGWIVLRNRQTEAPGTSVVVGMPTPHMREIRSPESPRAAFVANDEAIVVPLESPAADVTVVQVYPTVETERRWQRELTVHITHSEPNGGG